jgi:hypothetical protein
MHEVPRNKKCKPTQKKPAEFLQTTYQTFSGKEM